MAKPGWVFGRGEAAAGKLGRADGAGRQVVEVGAQRAAGCQPGVLGGDEGDVDQITLLGRIITWTPEGIEFEDIYSQLENFSATQCIMLVTDNKSKTIIIDTYQRNLAPRPNLVYARERYFFVTR